MAHATIDQVEYFFNADPGEGSGITLPITPGGGPGVPLKMQFSGISTSGLSVGTNLLHIRAHDDIAGWGPSRQHPIEITYPASTIAEAELFVDVDPGEGNGNPIAAPVDGVFNERTETIDTALGTVGWGSGGHTVFVRARNSLGVWGTPTPVAGASPPNVRITEVKWAVRAEFFFDVDPGKGMGGELILRSRGGSGVPATIDLAGIDISELAPGPHDLYLRVQDSEHVWGPTRKARFTITQPVYTLAGAEFFIDADPGEGSGVALAATDGSWDGGMETAGLVYNVGTLPPGPHTLCARGRDSTARWGAVPAVPQYPMCTDFEVLPPGEVVLSGTVTEYGTNRVLNGVSITSDDGGSAYSGNDGSFSLTVALGSRTLTFEANGYHRVDKVETIAAPVSGYAVSMVKVEQALGVQPNQGQFAEPVNTATGNYYYGHTDLKVTAPGTPFEFTRYYNAQDLTSGILGAGWSSNLEAYVYEWEGVVHVKYGDGRVERYLSDGVGGFAPQPGVHTQLSHDGVAYALLTKGQMHYQFDGAGRLVAKQDRNGNTLTINRDGAGRITTVVDPAGRSYTFTHAGGYLASITDPIGRQIVYSMDASGNLAAVTDARGNTTRYFYDSHHLLLSVLDPRGNAIVTNTYDALRRIVNYQTDAKGGATTFAYDSASGITTITDALGNLTRHYHDAELRLILEDDANGQSAFYTYDVAGNRIQVTDKNGNVTQYGYDASGNVTSKTDALGNVTSITYDASNNPLTRTDALGNVTSFSYDANGNLLSTTDAMGNVTSGTYDAAGLPLALTDALGNVTTSAYDAEGNLIQVTDALGNTTQYTFDGVGRRLSTVDALGRSTSYSNDASDNPLSVTDTLGNTVSNTFDANDNRLSTTDPNGNATGFTYDQKDLLTSTYDALGGVATSTYDALDRRIALTDANGNTTQYQYDAVGNLIGMVDALGNASAFTFDPNGNRVSATDPNGHTSTFNYDALNRRVAATDPLGNTTASIYDALGRVVSTTNAKGQGTVFAYDALGRLVQATDANGGTVQYAYDANGNRLTMVDANGHTTGYVYDAANRLTSKAEALGNITQYQYDAVGNLIQLTKPNGTIIQYAYDELDRLALVTYPDASTVTFSYNAVGNRTQMADSLGIHTYAYDALNRMTAHTDPYAKTVGYSYDAVGNRISLTYPGGQVVGYAYDAVNRLIGVTDWLTRTTTYTYDAGGRLSNTTNPNGTTAAYSYDAASRLTGLANARSDASVLSSYAYTLDALGNHNQVTQTEPLKPMLTAGELTYTNDAENRLTDASGTANIFDDNGNMTARGGDAFVYDFEDRLSQSTIGGVTSQYQYDGTGNRYSRTEGGATARYVLDTNTRLTGVLAETDAAGSEMALYVYGLGLIARVLPAGTASYYHFDSRGSTIAMTDSTETETAQYAYDPFGRVVNTSGTSTSPFTYLGQYGVMDEGNGMTYIRARYYDPALGRFINKDPKAGNDRDGQSLNRYVYALNNPIRLVDVSGFSASEGTTAGIPQNTSDLMNAGILDNFMEGAFGYVARKMLDWGVEGSVHSVEITLGRTPGLVAKDTVAAGVLVDLYFATAEELNQLGINRTDVVDAWRNLEENIRFAQQNPDARLEALITGVTSTTAIVGNVLAKMAINAGASHLAGTPNAFVEEFSGDVLGPKFTGEGLQNVLNKPGEWLGSKFYEWGLY